MPPALGSRSRRIAAPPAALRQLADGELIALARDGSDDAFEVIYDLHNAVAYALAYRICGAHVDPEDAVQAAFLSL